MSTEFKALIIFIILVPITIALKKFFDSDNNHLSNTDAKDETEDEDNKTSPPN